MEDYYKVLGVEEGASQDEIKKAYRKLSLLHHPDKNQGDAATAEEKFKNINEAYQIIGDETERQKYDMSKRNPFGNMGGNSSMSSGGHRVDPNDIFKMFFGSGGPGGPSGPGGPGMGMFGGMNGFPGGNIRVFQNGQPMNVNAMNKPPPIIKNIVISLEQAYKGDQIPVQIERWLFEDGIRKLENETLYIPIAKGIDDKEIIILRERGNVMDANLKGDVKIIISIQNSTHFKRSGLNLNMDREITLKDSLCGFEFIINHISGKQLRFKTEVGVPIRDGLVKSINGFGMERENNKGNLCIKFNVKYPDKLTSEQLTTLNDIL
jgi:DnaJ family protein B protein 4|tara:strand:+ start:1089 stop:2051 length:963 start_codon:yes stop_codon:yes gene_type:complete